jgi:17beta-estradiol 17-dehydrogenase / very-long-chain 3-oxoacyl-CoA reductase
VVTGASDGIGKQFAIQLSYLGFDIVLISRSIEKLEKVAGECNKEVQTKCIPFDYTSTDDKDWFDKF